MHVAMPIVLANKAPAPRIHPPCAEVVFAPDGRRRLIEDLFLDGFGACERQLRGDLHCGGREIPTCVFRRRCMRAAARERESGEEGLEAGQHTGSVAQDDAIWEVRNPLSLGQG